YAADALRTSSMNLNPGGKHPHQSLRGLTKGVNSVLIERAAWDNAMLMTYGNVVSMPPFPELLRCCARHCLASHADFRLWLLVMCACSSPSATATLNSIESYWGAAKRQARSNSD
ncbi:hypothetical protein H257_18008, partial [Aphanomyces astaci]